MTPQDMMRIISMGFSNKFLRGILSSISLTNTSTVMNNIKTSKIKIFKYERFKFRLNSTHLKFANISND
jgi:hypothetical protein